MTFTIDHAKTYQLPGPISKGYWDAVAQVESTARTYAARIPTAFVRGEGIYLTDADGNRYIDCLSGAGVLALGHNHPVITEAIRSALDQNVPIHALDLVTPAKAEFVETLLQSLPSAFAAHARIQFCSPSGADAVEAAIKLVKTATRRSTIVSFHGAYHGMSHGALGVTGDIAPKERVAGLMPGVHFFPYPYGYRCPFGVGGRAGAELGIRYLEHTLDDPHSGITPPAGLIVEAVQGEGGNIPAPDWWLRELRRITQERKIPLILDEIQTGCGRTGAMFAFEHAGIIPDVIVLSKAIGGGLPLAVMLYHESLDAWGSGAHVGTFRANQLAMIAGTAAIRCIRAEGLTDYASEMGERLQHQLEATCGDLPCVGDIRGRGLMVGIELIVTPADLSDDGELPPRSHAALAVGVQAECLRNGLLIETGGRHGSVLRLLPPLIIRPNEIDAIAGIIRHSVKECLDRLPV